MKHIFLILAVIGLTFTSCKKGKSMDPQPAPQSVTTPPTNTTTPTNTSTPTNTTVVNDSTNTDGSLKTKVYFSVRMPDVTSSVRDYKYDTLNLRIYHNDKALHINKINYNGTSGSIANFNNYMALTGTNQNLSKPVWMNVGDSLVVEIDSLEFVGTPFNQSTSNNNKLSIKKLVNNVLTEIDSRLIWDASLPSTFIGPYLGTGADSGTSINKDWYLGRKVRIKYILQ